MLKKAKVNGPASSSQLLGSAKIVDTSPVTTSKCVICDKVIPAARLEALKSLNLPASKWAHTACSTVTKVKGLYLGEVGTSQLQICDKVYNDSVRSMFRKADTEQDSDEDDRD